MNSFQRSTANIAAWNLEGFNGISDERIKKQIQGLSMLDAEVVALVEINPIEVIDKIKVGLKKNGLTYHSSLIEQSGKLHIGVFYKNGVVASNPRLIEGSDLGDPNKRKAFVLDLKIGKFDFIIIVVHLKSGRSLPNQKIRDEQAKVIFSFIGYSA